MHYINGLWIDSGTHDFVSTNPATNEILWKGKAAGVEEIHSAVETARVQFESWANKPYNFRHDIVQRFKEIVENHKEDLALLIAKETGKALWDAQSEAAAVCSKLTFSDEAYHERTGRKVRAMAGGEAVVTHRPHGVMAVYGPYNFPAHLPNGHVTPALLSGNTIVFKPSELTPMVAEWMVRKWEAAGLPSGVLNLVQGEKDTGIALARENINGVLFTGSSQTGKLLHSQFAGRPEVILALEMGGNNPLIVSRVSDILAAVYEAILSAFTGSGQRCTCARRLIIIENDKSQEFLDLFIKAARNLVVGSYDSQPNPFMGPLIHVREARRLMEAQDSLEQLGGEILLRMRQSKEELAYVTPSIIDMTGVSNVPDTEYFGPLVQIYRVSSLEEAIQEANNTKFGLSGSMFSDYKEEYQYALSKIQAGLFNWNRQTTGASGAGPFGGIGISGNHRPAGYYSADYCAYPVASVENAQLSMPDTLLPGIEIG